MINQKHRIYSYDLFRVALMTCVAFFFGLLVLANSLTIVFAVELENQSDISFLQADIAANPLKPPDTSSPKKTLTSFIENINEAHRILMLAHNQNLKSPGLFSSKNVIKMSKEAELFLIEQSIALI